jgi:hypothetical protein
MALKGKGGTLEIWGCVAGQIDEWQSHADMALRTVIFEATGSFASYWVSAGATEALVQAAPLSSASGPNLPDFFVLQGTITELTPTTIRMIGVKQLNAP